MSQPKSQEEKGVDYWKQKAEEQAIELERVRAALQSARKREETQRQKILSLPPPIDNNPIPRVKRDLLNPSQPAKTKRTKPFQFKGLSTAPTRRSPVGRASPPIRRSPSPVRRSPIRRSPSPIRRSPNRRISPPSRRSPSPVRRSPVRRSPSRVSPPSRHSPSRRVPSPKPLKSSLKRSPPKTFILRPVNVITGKAVDSPPIVVEKEMTIGRGNLKSLKAEPYFLNIPREAFKVTTENDELLITALRDTIEIQQAQSSKSEILAKGASAYLNSGDKVSIKDVLTFKISK